MVLNDDDYKLLSSYVGYGVIEHPLICFLGNESGTGGMSVDNYIPKFINNLNTWETNQFKKDKLDGFVLKTINDLPVSSIFLQFISRLMLGIECHNEQWFYSLSGSGKAFLNNYIINRFAKENTCIFNL